MAQMSGSDTIFVDESGTPSFTDQRDNRKDRGYILAAVQIPDYAREEIPSILPRGSDGSLLNASSEEMSSSVAAGFLSGVLDTAAEIGLVAIDNGSKNNETIAPKRETSQSSVDWTTGILSKASKKPKKTSMLDLQTQ